MKPPYFDLVRFWLWNFLTGRTERLPENTNACRAVWNTLTEDEQRNIETLILSRGNGMYDTSTIRDYADRIGLTEYAVWSSIKRVFRAIAVQRGIWPEAKAEYSRDRDEQKPESRWNP